MNRLWDILRGLIAGFMLALGLLTLSDFSNPQLENGQAINCYDQSALYFENGDNSRVRFVCPEQNIDVYFDVPNDEAFVQVVNEDTFHYGMGLISRDNKIIQVFNVYSGNLNILWSVAVTPIPEGDQK